jgi:hypothetical protein
LIENQAGKVGEALTIELEETVKSSFKTLQSRIISIVKDSKGVEESEEELNIAVRKAGVAIKDKAQAVRTWRQNYDRETNSLVSKAAEDTLQILDHIRDLGLQEIGMRWAWTDGITHKDWAKYHQLKPKFDEWRLEVEQIAVNHPGLISARAASEEVESKAMAIAEEAAKELARLKETGRWKISAEDSSDDFSTKTLPVAAAVAGQKILEKISDASEAIVGTSQGTVESVLSVASSSIADAVSSGSSIASSLTDHASSSIVGTQQGNVESAASVASAKGSSIIDQASSSIIGTQQGTVESVTSVASEKASSVVDQASSFIVGTEQGSVESVASVANSKGSGIVAQASSSIIGSQQNSVESVASVASEKASSIVDQASSSVIGTSQGTVESIVSAASDSASSASAKASSFAMGTEPGVVEQATLSIKSAASVVSDSAPSLSDAASSSISSESSIIFETVSKASDSISSLSSSVASSVSSSISNASGTISSAAPSASSTASKKIWGGAMAQHVEARQIIFEDIVKDDEEDTYSEKIQSLASEAGDRFADITKAVSEALLKATSTQGAMDSVATLAAEQYSSALAAASSALYGTEQGTGESISSLASSRYADAVSA